MFPRVLKLFSHFRHDLMVILSGGRPASVLIRLMSLRMSSAASLSG